MNTRTPDQLRALVPADADLRYISPDLRPLAVPVAELLKDPRNARRHPDKNLTTIRDSFLRFGQRQALVVNRRNLVTEAGNGRLQVAQSLGWQYIAVSFEDDDALTATAFGLVDNQSALTAEWDDEIRAELLHGLQEEGEDLSKLGFDDDDLAKLLAIKSDNDKFDDDSIDKTGDVNTNRADELQKEWQTERGQVWGIPSVSMPGRCHRVVCGDSLDPAVIALALDGLTPDGVWSDAPYGMNFDTMKTRGKTANGAGLALSIPRPRVLGDNTIDTAQTSFSQLWKACPQALHIWWGANHYSSCFPESSCWIVWDKENNGDFADAELAWCSDKGSVRLFRHMWNGMIKASERGERRLHATQKPIALFEWCAQKYLPGQGKVWLDPFAGSGISLLGAERLGQIACCVELSEAYVAVILQRAKDAGLTVRKI